MKRWVGVLLVVVCGAMTGCIEFLEQTMSYRHDVAADTLFIFQRYEGIFGGDKSKELTDEEKTQIDSVLEGERTFFFNNWISEFNRADLEEKKAKPPDAPGGTSSEEANRALIDLALANVKVENVGFYLNAEKQLCGAQRVTIRHFWQVLAALNKALLFEARREAEQEDKSAEEKAALRAFAGSGRDPLKMEGNRLEMCWAVTPEEYGKFKESRYGAAFRASGGTSHYAEGILTLVIGAKEAKMVSLTLPFAEKPYANNLMEVAEKHRIRESWDPVQAAQQFLLSHKNGSAKE